MRYIFAVYLGKIHSAVLYILSRQGGELFDPGDLEGQGHPNSIGFFDPMRNIFGVKLVKIQRADKASQADRRTDRRKQLKTIRTPSALWAKGQILINLMQQ